MTDRARIRIAAIVTALFLGLISAVGLAARSEQPAAPPPAAATARATAPAVAPQAAVNTYRGDLGSYEQEHEDDD
jgi:hypothetical protein